MKTYTGTLKYKRCNKRNYDCEISEESVGKENLCKPINLIRNGNRASEERAGANESDRSRLAVCKLCKRATEEVTEAYTKCGERKTGYVLICPEGYGKEDK